MRRVRALSSSALAAPAARRRRHLPEGPAFGDFLRSGAAPAAAVPAVADAPRTAPSPLPGHLLTDTFGRKHTYLRISLTERCNLRCTYCMPADGVPEPVEALGSSEIERVASVFARMGVSKVRLTGGEPTLRRDLVGVCRSISGLDGVRSLGLTTNGVNLLRKEKSGARLVDALADAGVSSINVSLDTLDADAHARLTRRPAATHARVLAAIEASAAAGIRTKVNCVVMRGENDRDLAAFARHWASTDVEVRFIEWMPFQKNAWDSQTMVPYDEMLKRIDRARLAGEAFEERPPHDAHDTTKWWSLGDATVGFITSMSNHFCGSCNRVRVTADGHLKTCLFGSDSLDLKDALRGGGSDEALANAVHAALQKKHFKHGGADGADGIAAASDDNRPMVRIGG